VVDRPLAVISAVNTATPATYWVSVDHLNRPVKMTSSTKASVWDAIWQPWGGVHSVSGSATLDARFPGQWFQTETGLHYNWHRSYDPTLGRYTQPDPLGFVDGPSVYGYAGGSPHRFVDRDGRISLDDIIIQMEKNFICPILRTQVLLECKNEPIALFKPNKCTPSDSCEILEQKYLKRRRCIASQTLLTKICYPDDPTHEERIEGEINAINWCRKYFSERGCGCLAPA
jgi:RHS repeat-associated protein